MVLSEKVPIMRFFSQGTESSSAILIETKRGTSSINHKVDLRRSAA